MPNTRLLRLLSGAVLAISFFVFAPGAHAAATLVNSATCYLSGGSCSVTLSNTAGNLLWVGINEYNDNDTLGVSDSAGNSYIVASPAATTTNSNSPQLIQTFYAENIAAAPANVITCTRSGQSSSGRCTVLEYSGLATSASLDAHQESPQQGVSTFSSGNAVTANASDLLIGFFATRSTGGSWTPGSGWTTVATSNTDFDVFVESVDTISQGSYAATAGYSSVAWGVGSVNAFKVAGGATSTDATAPTAPTGLAVTNTTAASVALSWSASTDPDNTASQISYAVYRNGIRVGTTAAGTTSYTDSGLTASTNYSYAATAADPAGNTSAQSASVSGTTQAAAAVSCSPSSQSVQAGQGASFTASGGTGSYSWSAPSGNPSTGSGSSFSATYASTGNYTVTVTSGAATAQCAVTVTAPAPRTYYISSSGGNDSYDGTEKVHTTGSTGPWAHAPGMNAAIGNPAAYGPNSRPGDTFIFKGCDVWTGENFAWVIGVNSGWSIHGYYSPNTSVGAGYSFLGDSDKSWYNAALCPSGWSRPVLDACKVSAPSSGNLPGCTGSNVAETAPNVGVGYPQGGGDGSIVEFIPNYTTISGFEIRNHYHGRGSKPGWDAAFIAAQYTNYGDVRNMYYHAWIEPTPVKTTATVSQGSNIVTVIGSMSGIAVGQPIGLECTYCVFPPANNGPIVSAINGNQLTITDGSGIPVYAQNNDCSANACTFLGGWDSGAFTPIQGFPNSTGMTFENNIIDGWDTALVQADPGCALDWIHPSSTYGRCLGSLTVFYQGPAIVKNNVMRYVSSFHLGGIQEFSGNRLENERVSINPTAHSNGMEGLGDSNLGAVVHDNVFYGVQPGVPLMVAPAPKFATVGSMAAGSATLTVSNPQSFCGWSPCGFYYGWYVKVAGAGPGGSDLIGLITNISGNTITLDTAASAAANNAQVTSGGLNPTYIYNNVISDITNNFPIELAATGFGNIAGTVKVWNNTVEGGTDPNDGTQIPPHYPTAPMSGCPSWYQGCDYQNNHFLSCTGSTSAGDCTKSQPLLSPCGANCTQSNNVSDPLGVAGARGMTFNTTPYSFAPTANSPTIGAGANLSSNCSLSVSSGNVNINLSSLCRDTTYAVGYDAVNHALISPARTALSRPASGAWDAGAYQYSGSGTPVTPPPPVDTTPPTVTLIAPASGSSYLTTASAITVSANASDNVGVTKVQFTLDGQNLGTPVTQAPYQAYLNPASLSPGSHTLSATASDAAGNTGVAANVTITITAPAQALIALLAASPVSGIAPLTVSLTATASGTAQGVINFTFYCNRSDTGTNVTIPNDLAVSGTAQNPYNATGICTYSTAGTYMAKVIVERGTASPAQAQAAVTVSNATAGTLILGNITTSTSNTTAVIGWATNFPADSRVAYGLSAANLSGSVSSSTLVLSHALGLSGLAKSKTYYAQVFSTDASGAQTSSSLVSFTTQGKPSKVKNLSATNGSVVLTWNSPDGTYTSFVIVRRTDAFSRDPAADAAFIIATPGAGVTTYHDTNVQPGTTYFYSIFTMDSAGVASDPATISFTAQGSSSPAAGGGGAGGGGSYTPPVSTGGGGGGGGGSVYIPPVSTSTSTDPFPRSLTMGDYGSDVVLLNTALASLNYLPSSLAHGNTFTVATQHALALFQQDHQLAQTGSLGPQSQDLMNKVVHANPVLNGSVSGNSAIPAGSSASAAGAVFSRALSLGSTGDDVTRLQNYLVAQAYLAATPTGYYGTLTQAAVQKFQCAEGLVCTGSPGTTGYGSVGPKTRAALNILLGAGAGTATPTPAAPAPATPGTRTLFLGLAGDDVKALQDILINDGFLAPGMNTGYYGLLTEKAVQAFQCAEGIVCTGSPDTTGYGTVGPKTRGKL